MGLAIVLAAVVHGQQASVWDGIFVEEQASRGKSLYAQQCAACHGGTLMGRNGPPLTGAIFQENWNGLTTDGLFEYIRKSMPRGQAGTLSPEQATDLMAFLFDSNGFPAGKKELPSKAESLQTIRFEAARAK